MGEFLQLVATSTLLPDISFSRIAWLAGGGGLGALLRYRLGILCAAYTRSNFPYGILLSNVLGSFLMGALAAGCLVGFFLSEQQQACIAQGFFGALTTFSTFSVDVFSAWNEGNRFIALLNLCATLLCGLSSAACGYWLVVWICSIL